MDKSDSKGHSSSAPSLEEGRDYYWENGYMVFTEIYLLRRGKCCGCGCRHCPYRKQKSKVPPKQA